MDHHNPGRCAVKLFRVSKRHRGRNTYCSGFAVSQVPDGLKVISTAHQLKDLAPNGLAHVTADEIGIKAMFFDRQTVVEGSCVCFDRARDVTLTVFKLSPKQLNQPPFNCIEGVVPWKNSLYPNQRIYTVHNPSFFNIQIQVFGVCISFNRAKDMSLICIKLSQDALNTPPYNCIQGVIPSKDPVFLSHKIFTIHHLILTLTAKKGEQIVADGFQHSQGFIAAVDGGYLDKEETELLLKKNLGISLRSVIEFHDESIAAFSAPQGQVSEDLTVGEVTN